MASVTITYARAFADAVFDGHHDPDKTLREAQAVTELVAQSKELRAVWEAPSITAEQKRAVLDAIVARQGISRTVRNFVAVERARSPHGEVDREKGEGTLRHRSSHTRRRGREDRQHNL